MQLARFTLAISFLMISYAEAAAADFVEEIRGGVLLQGTGPFSGDKESGVGVNAEILFKPLSGLSMIGAPRPHLGASIASAPGATSQVYAGLTWRQRLAPAMFLDAGFGVAVHDGETRFNPSARDINSTKFLGCRALFRIAGDLGYRLSDRLSVSAHVDHISNAGLCAPNEGLDNTGVRFGWRF